MKRQWLMGVRSCAVWAAMGTIAVAQAPQSQSLGDSTPPQGAGAGQQPGGRGMQAGPPANALFSVIDADGDGTITKVELRKAVAALKKLDLNKDGKITLAETMEMPAGATGPINNGGIGVNGGQAGFGNRAGSFNGAGDPRSGPNLSQLDRNGDGSLSPDEVPPQMMGLVRGSDQNGNGKLDPNELAIVKQRMDERVRGQRAMPPGVTVGPNGVKHGPPNP